MLTALLLASLGPPQLSSWVQDILGTNDCTRGWYKDLAISAGRKMLLNNCLCSRAAHGPDRDFLSSKPQSSGSACPRLPPLCYSHRFLYNRPSALSSSQHPPPENPNQHTPTDETLGTLGTALDVQVKDLSRYAYISGPLCKKDTVFSSSPSFSAFFQRLRDKENQNSLTVKNSRTAEV